MIYTSFYSCDCSGEWLRVCFWGDWLVLIFKGNKAKSTDDTTSLEVLKIDAQDVIEKQKVTGADDGRM